MIEDIIVLMILLSRSRLKRTDQVSKKLRNVRKGMKRKIYASVLGLAGVLCACGTQPGQTIELGLAENAVGITEDHTLYSQEIYDKGLDLQVQIVAGELTPPATEEEYNAFCE